MAAVEVTAMLVAAPRIAGILGIPNTHAGWILNAYLYPVFAVLLLFLIRNGDWIRHVFSARGIFVAGLGLFSVGNLLSCFSATPSIFFAGRILQAIGGAMAYLGQLWTAMVYFRDRILTVMFWGECGLAIGIISGPMIGGYLVVWGESGWRMIFLLNAALALVLAYLHYLWNIPVLFVLGAGMGMASVSLYGRIAQLAPTGGFVRISILYLLAQQLGNAMGVQIEETVAAMHARPLTPALVLIGPLLLCYIFALRRKATEKPVTETFPPASF